MTGVDDAPEEMEAVLEGTSVRGLSSDDSLTAGSEGATVRTMVSGATDTGGDESGEARPEKEEGGVVGVMGGGEGMVIGTLA